MLKMAEVILLRTDKEPTPVQLAQKACSLATALHNEMVAGLAELDLVTQSAEPLSDPEELGKPYDDTIPTLGREGLAKALETSPACPDCQGRMKRRTGRFGVFWGCASFPGCRGIVK